MQAKIKVVLAEDEIILRQGIAAKIEKLDSDFLIAAQADNGVEALEAVERLAPDVLITDIKMPEMDGMELIKRVRLSYPKVKVVILSGYSDFSYTQRAIRYGVSSYLLKPVEDEALMDVLLELKNEIVTAQFYRKHTIVYSDNYLRGIGHTLHYYLFSVCIGNLCYDAADPYMREWYSGRPPVNWPGVLNQLASHMRDWSVSDEDTPNRKLVCIRCPMDRTLDPLETAEKLQKRLRALLPEVPVSICTVSLPRKREEVWMCAQRLSNILHQQLLPAQSRLFLLERDELIHTEERLGIIKMRVQEQLRQSIEKKDREEIRRELTMIFRYMVDLPASQQDIQKVITYIIRMCEFSGMEEPARDQKKILRILSCASDPTSLTQTLVDSILQSLSPEEKSEDIGIRLVEYVDRHYLQLEHLEELTQTFSYSYDHLSRLFKKQTGISLSHYVQEKRLELAKGLIAGNEGLNIGQVAQMAGFSDRRYFLRAFKAHTGMSPGDYRKTVCSKL